MSITLILAATVPALGVGRNGSLPWRLSREMRFFRQVTQGHVVVMGRRTWESIPAKFRPLAGRINIVITQHGSERSFDGAQTAESLGDALTLAERASAGVFPVKQVFIIGGAQLYQAALQHPATDAILLTEIKDHDSKIECDRFFDFNKEQWPRADLNALRNFVGEHVELPADGCDTENDLDFEFTLRRRADPSA